MAVYHGAAYASQEVFLKHFLSLLGVTHIAHVFFVHGVEIASLYPAGGESGFLYGVLHGLVGVHHKALGVRDSVAQEDACHSLAGAVLDSVARVYHQGSVVLELLQACYRALLAAHIDYYAFFHASGVELFLRIGVHFVAALAQLVGHDIEYGCVVAYVVGGVCAGSHYSGYLYFSHC